MTKGNASHSRRAAIKLSLAAAAVGLPGATWARNTPTVLTAGRAQVKPFSSQPTMTEAWGYNAQVCGPTLRVKQGDWLKLRFENDLKQPTSVHWHGLRIPNAMDGVGSITQPGVPPGGSFDYAFKVPDAGLFWYHPHMNSEKQIAKGLFGAIVVEEEAPPPVDREVIWTLFDWGLTDAYQLPGDRAFALWRGMKPFATRTKVTTNGVNAEQLVLRKGERVRLRIVNTSAGRRFALKFDRHHPHVIAWDGNAVKPYIAAKPIIVGNGERVDLIFDGQFEAGQRFDVTDHFDQRYKPDLEPTVITQIRYDQGALHAVGQLPPVSAPPPNEVAMPDLAQAERIDITLEQSLYEIGKVPQIGQAGVLLAALHNVPAQTKVPVWSMNGKVLFEDLQTFQCGSAAPIFRCQLGKTYRLRFINKTPTDHPMHLHGHTFLMVSCNGQPYPTQMLRDSFMVLRGESVEVAFVADNPGDWMIHCHRGLHSHGGMMGTFRVDA